MDINDFVGMYENIINDECSSTDIDILYESISRISKGSTINYMFTDNAVTENKKINIISDTANKLYKNEDNLIEQLYPGAHLGLTKSMLEGLNESIGKSNSEYFSTFLSNSGILLLNKQVGKTTLEDISEEIKEYDNLFRAQLNSTSIILISNAELVTLWRYSKDKKYLDMLERRGFNENEPMVVGGYASVEMIDREGHLITTEALKKAFVNFMKNFRARPIMLAHSDLQVGYPMPAYINQSNEVFKSGVNDKGLYLISEVRNDVQVAKRVVEAIEDGEVKSYSIAGTATDKAVVTKGARTYMQVNALELVEVTLCLPAGEKVWTKKGLVNIEDIKVDDLVLTHKLNWKRVIETMSRTINEDLVKITTDKSTFIATKEHPVRVIRYHGRKGGTKYEWVSINEIKIDDLVSFLRPGNNSFSKVMRIDTVPYEGLVYNLEVEDDNSYVTEGATFHNCEKPVNQDANFKMLKSFDIKKEKDNETETDNKSVRLSREEIEDLVERELKEDSVYESIPALEDVDEDRKRKIKASDREIKFSLSDFNTWVKNHLS